jgi:hypothetical protein
MVRRIEGSQEEVVSNINKLIISSPFPIQFYLSVAMALASKKIGRVAVTTIIPKTTSSAK